jgi:hypothetical protein
MDQNNDNSKKENEWNENLFGLFVFDFVGFYH